MIVFLRSVRRETWIYLASVCFLVFVALSAFFGGAKYLFDVFFPDGSFGDAIGFSILGFGFLTIVLPLALLVWFLSCSIRRIPLQRLLGIVLLGFFLQVIGVAMYFWRSFEVDVGFYFLHLLDIRFFIRDILAENLLLLHLYLPSIFAQVLFVCIAIGFSKIRRFSVARVLLFSTIAFIVLSALLFFFFGAGLMKFWLGVESG